MPKELTGMMDPNGFVHISEGSRDHIGGSATRVLEVRDPNPPYFNGHEDIRLKKSSPQGYSPLMEQMLGSIHPAHELPPSINRRVKLQY